MRLFNINSTYYINTSEIPGEISSVNIISSCVKITCYFKSGKTTKKYLDMFLYDRNIIGSSSEIFCFLWPSLAIFLFNLIYYHEWVQWTSEVSSWTLKEKFYIYGHPEMGTYVLSPACLATDTSKCRKKEKCTWWVPLHGFLMHLWWLYHTMFFYHTVQMTALVGTTTNEKCNVKKSMESP